MATAKIVIETLANNDGLQKLNNELAAGCMNLKAAQTELRNLEKATNGGTTATAEQAARMRELNAEIIRQKQYNGQLNKAINETTNEIKKQVSGMGEAQNATSLWSKAMQTLGINSQTLNTALGVLGGNILTSVVTQMKDMAVQTMQIGANTQKFTATLQGMGLSATDALNTYRAFNDVARDTNFNADGVYQIGQQMMLLGLNAEQAAQMMRICADAGVGLGKGQQGAEQLAHTMAKIAATGRLGTREIDALKMSGINAVEILAQKTGESADNIEKALSQGAINGQYAFGILADYMQSEFAGAMQSAKNNVIDQWGDVTGNMQAMMAEIGMSIFDAFNQSGIIQELIDITQALLTMIRSDATGIFSDLGSIAKWALGIIGDGLSIVTTTIKIAILAVKDLYDGFRTMCADVINWLKELLWPLVEAYNWIKKIVSAIGNEIKSQVDASWKDTFSNSADNQSGNVAISNKGANTFSGLISSYGNLDKAQKQAIINQQKFNKETKDTIDWQDKLVSAFSGLSNQIFNDSSNLLESLSNMFSDFTKDICSMLMQIYLKGLMVQALGLGGSSLPTPSGGMSNLLSTFRMHANGGIAEGWSIVGERGPELVNFSNPGRVYTAGETAAALGGGNTNVTVEIINQSGQQLQGRQGTPTMDLKGVIVPVFLEAVGENYGGITNILKGATR